MSAVVAQEPYTQEISRSTPALMVFLLDQSFSMEDQIGGNGPRKCEALANTLNTWLENLIIRATGSSGVKDYMHIIALGYRTDAEDGSIVRIDPALCPPLNELFQQQGYVAISDVARHAEVKRMISRVYDSEAGEEIEVPIDKQSWIEPVREGGTPMCTALYQTHGLVSRWIESVNHRQSFPPIVVHITDGEAMDGDPVPYAESLRSLSTDNGNVLLFNCHLSQNAADKIMFPSQRELLCDQFAPQLFEMSSLLPQPILQQALNDGFPLQPNARGFVFNADAVSLVQFLDIGTRVVKTNLR